MYLFGSVCMTLAFVSCVASLLCGVAALWVKPLGGRKGAVARVAAWTALANFALLTVCCLILVVCFLIGDYSIYYVLEEHSNGTGLMGILYRVSGLWAGRAGSLLFWAWLITLFNAFIARRVIRGCENMDQIALLVMNVVLLAFQGVLVFSSANAPFAPTPEHYLNADGTVAALASSFGMNPLLEHWAQAIHPPTLFVGYAGLTVPFAYALAALISGDLSATWVRKSNRFAMISWLFLGIGIGLGSVWAYVVLGWGGYWGWDAVENASLLSWLMALALVHSMTIYRQRGGFKRWGVMCACLTFAFVITGTFITRSGIVQSVHAFEGDPVSLVLFGFLICMSVAAGLVGIVLRWKALGADDDFDSLFSKDAAYYFNNIIAVVFTLLLCYMTVSSALPNWLPFGGSTLTAGSYNAIARPLGVGYCLIVAVCPLLGWVRTDKAEFFRLAKIPAICAAVMFAVLCVYFATTLYPAYMANISAGTAEAIELMNEGPVWYYNGLAVVGFLVASLLFFNTLFMIGRAVSKRTQALKTNPVKAFFGAVVSHSSKYGGYIAHLGMAVILVGLIGSSMYVTETTDYIAYEEGAAAADKEMVIDDYRLVYSSGSVNLTNGDTRVNYQVELDVYDVNTGAYIGHVTPSVDMVMATQQTKMNASVINRPTEDLFVVYRGVSEDNQMCLDVRVNPLISFTWVGFALLMVGTAIAAFGTRKEA